MIRDMISTCVQERFPGVEAPCDTAGNNAGIARHLHIDRMVTGV